jgi:hypothetical protein
MEDIGMGAIDALRHRHQSNRLRTFIDQDCARSIESELSHFIGGKAGTCMRHG